MTRFLKTAAILAALMMFGGCAAAAPEASSASLGVANPLIMYESVEAIAEAVDFSFQVPAEAPEGYTLSVCYTVLDEIVSLEYTDGEQKVLYRTAKASDKYDPDVSISGDYTDYKMTTTVPVGDFEVTFSCDGETSPGLALWSGNDMLYSLSGLTLEEAENCIYSLTWLDS